MSGSQKHEKRGRVGLCGFVASGRSPMWGLMPAVLRYWLVLAVTVTVRGSSLPKLAATLPTATTAPATTVAVTSTVAASGTTVGFSPRVGRFWRSGNARTSSTRTSTGRSVSRASIARNPPKLTEAQALCTDAEHQIESPYNAPAGSKVEQMLKATVKLNASLAAAQVQIAGGHLLDPPCPNGASCNDAVLGQATHDFGIAALSYLG